MGGSCSEFVFPLPQGAEHGHGRGVWRAMRQGLGDHRGLVKAQEGVDLSLQTQACRQSGQALGPQLGAVCPGRLDGGLIGLNGSGEPMPQWFQHARSRPLSAEELIESWRIVTGWRCVMAH